MQQDALQNHAAQHQAGDSLLEPDWFSEENEAVEERLRRCPKCLSAQIHASRCRTTLENLIAALGGEVLRCHLCNRRTAWFGMTTVRVGNGKQEGPFRPRRKPMKQIAAPMDMLAQSNVQANLHEPQAEPSIGHQFEDEIERRFQAQLAEYFAEEQERRAHETAEVASRSLIEQTEQTPLRQAAVKRLKFAAAQALVHRTDRAGSDHNGSVAVLEPPAPVNTQARTVFRVPDRRKIGFRLTEQPPLHLQFESRQLGRPLR